MKRGKIERIGHLCKFCGGIMKTSDFAYLENPFCHVCREARLEASGAIDLTDNHEIIDLGNGYVKLRPIDPDKKYKRKR